MPNPPTLTAEELAKRIRELASIPANSPEAFGCADWADTLYDNADRIASALEELSTLRRQLQEADGIIEEMTPRYRHDCNYCHRDLVVCARVPRGGCLLQDERYMRHASRAGRRG